MKSTAPPDGQLGVVQGRGQGRRGARVDPEHVPTSAVVNEAWGSLSTFGDDGRVVIDVALELDQAAALAEDAVGDAGELTELKLTPVQLICAFWIAIVRPPAVSVVEPRLGLGLGL